MKTIEIRKNQLLLSNISSFTRLILQITHVSLSSVMNHQLPYLEPQNIDEFSFTFKVRLKLGLIAIAIATGTAFTYHKLEDKYKDTFNFGATVFGVSIAGVSAIHAYRDFVASRKIQSSEILVSREEKILDRTIAYISRWNCPEYGHFRATIKEIIGELEANKISNLKDHLEENREKAQDIITILNFLEELAFLIDEGLIHEERARKYFRGIVIQTYTKLSSVIHVRKQATNERAYEYLCNLYNKWDSNGTNKLDIQ